MRLRIDHWYIFTAQTMKRVAHELNGALLDGKLIEHYNEFCSSPNSARLSTHCPLRLS